MELDGEWRAAEADEELRRAYPAPDFGDDGWETIAVPGHWRSVPAFASSDGPILTRTRFEHPDVTGDRRAWLTFEGIFYAADVWLDGSYVGDTEGYFAPHTFEVTEAMRARPDHVLAVEVACAPQPDARAKRNLTGVFQQWAGAPEANPGGIWRPVRVHETGPVALGALRVLCVEASAERAVLTVTAAVDATGAVEAVVRTRVGASTSHESTHSLAGGVNQLEWTVVVDSPPLWWPHALAGSGGAELVDVHVSVAVGGVESDGRSLRTGIRQVAMRDWTLSVNGERLFLKGSNLAPARMAIADATPAEIERDVVLAKAAGLDLLRVHGHVSRPELYDAADRHGMLLWQDLPLQGSYARGVRKQAVRQAKQAVDLLGHHPSIAIWCAHTVGRGAAALPLPAWGKTILDGSVCRALERADRSRPALPHAGVLGRTSSHLYFGWYDRDERDLATFAAAWPRAVRFVGEFGAPAPAAGDVPLDPGPEFARNGLDRARFASAVAWSEAAQAYQATVVRHHVETLRRLKYRPAGGFAQFLLADTAGAGAAAAFGVLDHERTPKPGYEALAAACAPVIVVADRPRESYAPGEAIALDVHVVSDRREPIEGAVVRARLTWPGGGGTWTWTGTIPADACVRAGTVQAVLPEGPAPGAPGDATATEPGAVPLTLELELEADGGRVKAGNRYESVVT